MTGGSLLNTYYKLREIGLTRNKTDFAIHLLGRGKTFLRDIEHRRGREGISVPMKTIVRLRTYLRRLADRLPNGALRRQVEAIIHGIDRDLAVAERLAR